MQRLFGLKNAPERDGGGAHVPQPKKRPTNGYEGSLLSGIPHNIHKEIAALEATGTKAMLIIAGTPKGVNLLDAREIEPALRAGYERANVEAPAIGKFWG